MGVFGLGNPCADYAALQYVKKRYSGRTEDVVVNGAGIEMFAAVAKLIKCGIAPSRITVVTPEEEGKVKGFPERKVFCFPLLFHVFFPSFFLLNIFIVLFYRDFESEIEMQITEPLVKGLLSVGVKMCWGFAVSEATLSKAGFLESVDLQRVLTGDPLAAPSSVGSLSQASKATSHSASTSAHDGPAETAAGPAVVVPCIALLNCHQQLCDYDVFCAINDCGLVFDGGLVVDTVSRIIISPSACDGTES